MQLLKSFPILNILNAAPTAATTSSLKPSKFGTFLLAFHAGATIIIHHLQDGMKGFRFGLGNDLNPPNDSNKVVSFASRSSCISTSFSDQQRLKDPIAYPIGTPVRSYKVTQPLLGMTQNIRHATRKEQPDP